MSVIDAAVIAAAAFAMLPLLAAPLRKMPARCCSRCLYYYAAATRYVMLFHCYDIAAAAIQDSA